MANIVNLEQVTKSHGTTVLLDRVSLGLDESDRVGVVGLNGAGKTTLLRVLTRDEPADSGRVTHRGGVRLGRLGQQVELPPGSTVRDVVLGDAWLAEGFGAEHEWAGDAGVRGVLDGLGLPAIGLDTEVGPLSGGERRRVALAALLVRETDLLVLDEPTNHLDVEGIAWLAEHLAGRRGALLAVTHDRWFLDAVCSRTWEVVSGGVSAYDGGYSAYVLARAERARTAAATEQRRQNLLRKELAWLRRGPPARTSKPRFRIEAAQALIVDEPPPRDEMRLRTFAAARLGRRVYDVEGVTVRLAGGDGAGRVLLDDVTWLVGPGDRIGVVGVNGSGKTTLLRLLTGERPPDTGRVTVGTTVRVAYLSQEVAELPPGLRVLEAVQEVAQRVRLGDRELSAGQLCELFGFGGARQWTPVGDLSGGERRRLQLLRLLMGEPNVLLLDEPTNDLDIDTLTALEDVLDSWPGTLVVVSHDRYLVERVCDTVVALLGDGRLTMLPGGIEEYLRRRRAEGLGPGGVGRGPEGSRPASGAGAAASRPSPSPAQAQAPATGAGELRAARKEMTRLERRLGRLDGREQELLGALAEHAADHARVLALDEDLRSVRAERQEIEDAWLVAAEAAEG